MSPQALQLIPYVAIAFAILLGIAIVVIGLNRFRRARPRKPDVILHDPDSSKPHDLDDPFFDPKVRERVGTVIANAVVKRAKR